MPTGTSAGEGEDWVLVEGAGTPAVNGLYKRVADFQGAPRFVMEGQWEGRPCEFTILRCATAGGRKRWFISICDENEPGTDLDIDFYASRLSTDSENIFVPRGRWRRARPSVPGAVLPAPLVTPVHEPEDVLQIKMETISGMTELVAMRVRCPRWELWIRRAIGEYVQTVASCFDTAACDRLFQKHEFSECLNVVEMAFWKAVCLTEMPETVKGYHQLVHWQKEGWKVNKKAMRSSSSVNTLMELIIPFLEKPWEQQVDESA